MTIRTMVLSLLVWAPVLLTGEVSSAQVVTTPAPIPANQVNLSDFGGVPGAGRTAIVSAFGQAFTKLKSLGGGTLNIAPGTYDYGAVNSTQYIVYVSDLKNILIKGYGAKFTMDTTANPSIAHFFGIVNPTNVTIAGLGFYDFSPYIGNDQNGALCFDVMTTKPSKQFKTVDIKAEHVYAFLRSYAGSTDGTAYMGTEYDINGSLIEGYYGLVINYNGRFSKANLTVHNIRRAFISYGTRDWDLTINASSTGVRGSDGLIDFIPLPQFPVQDTKIVMNFSGNLNYTALIHFYNQNSPSGLTGDTYTKNVRAHVNLTNVKPDFNKAIFLHDFGGAATTTRAFENIYLSGTLNSTYKPVMIASPTVSTAPTSSVYVSQTLASLQNMSTLPSYFHVIPDWGTSPSPFPSPTPTPTPTPTPAPSPSPTPVVAWTRCASENGVCSFSGTRQVRYGANGVYAYKTATGSIACNNSVFGDPVYGVVKTCDYSSSTVVSPSPTPVVTWTRCASENGVCTLSGTRQVRYGANGVYVYKTATDSIACNNSVFGDPVFGVVKACDYSTL